MNYLIFRTDRIGDYIITSSLINAIKRNNNKSKIYIVCSPKNIKFIKEFSVECDVFLLKSNRLIDKLKLLIALKKIKFDAIIVTDKKNRSIILTILLNSKNKIFNVSKLFQKKLLNIFYKKVFLDDEKFLSNSKKAVMNKNCKAMGFNLIEADLHYLSQNQFHKYYLHNQFINLDKLDFLIFHYDEKWELENYSKLFKKAAVLTPISPGPTAFMNFILDLTRKTTKTVIISTGNIETHIIKELKKSSQPINKFLYKLNFKDVSCFILINENFFSMSHIISKSKLFIGCHGAFTHIASNYNIKILDIIENIKKDHYANFTKHMNNYNYLYRNNFNELSKNILKSL